MVRAICAALLTPITIWAVLSACSPSESLTSVPVTGESFDSPIGHGTSDTPEGHADGAIDLSVESPVIDYDAEWKAFVRESVLVHEQKPEHPFWSAARTASTRPPMPAVDIGAEMYALQAEIDKVLQFLDAPQPKPQTLKQLVNQFFEPHDRDWALLVAFCESSGQPNHASSDAVHPSSRASGWFQHLPKFWDERSAKAGFDDASILDPVANVGVASWLFYEGGGKRHWNESKACWG